MCHFYFKLLLHLDCKSAIKTLLPNYREFSDIRYFTSLMEVAQERHAFPEDFLSPVTLTFSNNRTLHIGPLICEDSWDDNYPFKPMSYLSQHYDIDLFVNISNSPFTQGKRSDVIACLERLSKPCSVQPCMSTAQAFKITGV